MIELLPLSIGIGLAVGLLVTEILGIASGGLIVPGYIALYLMRPWDLLLTIGIALIAFGVVRVLSTFLIIYGRRRTAIMILSGYLLGMLVRGWAGYFPGEYDVIGFIIPGLIATWMDRQGVLETMSAMTIVSVIVRLILILTVGTEVSPS